MAEPRLSVAEGSLLRWTQPIYALHAFSLLTGILGAATVIGAFLTGWPSIIAVVLNYVKRPRRSRHLARVALPLADSDVLVRPAVGVALPGVRRRHARHRPARRLAADAAGRSVVHLPDRPRLAGAERQPARCTMNVASGLETRRLGGQALSSRLPA